MQVYCQGPANLSGGGDLRGETIGTVRKVSNNSLEDGFPRFLHFNKKRAHPFLRQ